MPAPRSFWSRTIPTSRGSPNGLFGCGTEKWSDARSMISSFIWKMAWRDSRSSRRRLLLFSISITLGIAALVSIGSFRHSLAKAIDDQARSLIGADLVIESTRAFRPEDEELLHSL